MRHRVSAAIALLAIAQGACGERRPAEGPRVEKKGAISVEAGEPKGALLWRVEGAKGPVWIFGTLHLAKEDSVPPIVWGKLEASSTFVMEADLAEVNPFALVKRASLPPEESLDAMVGEARWKKLVEKVGDRMPALALKRFKPWFATTVLTLALVTGSYAMDQEFSRRAKDAGKKLVYLESAESQIALLERSTDLDDLNDLIDDLDEAKASMDDLVAAYHAGDAAAISDAMEKGDTSDPGETDALLKERNERWLPAIEKLITEEGNAFIAVGAGHVLGEHGVPELLRRRGHEVERWVADP